MARKAREKSSTGKYIIMLRGTDEDLFKSKKTKELFELVATEILGGNLIGIRFFNNRVVMVVKETNQGIGLDMKPLLISFARTYNRDNKTDGKVFDGRFKSIPIESDECEKEYLAYINGERVRDPFAPKDGSKIAVRKPKAEKKPESDTEVNYYEKPKRKIEMPTWLL